MRLKAGTWKVDKSLRSPVDIFSERLGDPSQSFESRWIWEDERLWGLYTYRTVLMGEDGSFKLETIINGNPVLYLVFVVAIFQLYDTVFSNNGALTIISATTVWLVILYYLYAPQFNQELYDLGSLTNRNVSPVLFLLLLSGLILLWYRLRNLHPSYPVDAVALICFCYLLIASYSLNLLPFISKTTNNSILFAPSLVLQRLVFSIGIFAAFGFFVGFFWFQTDFAVEQISNLEPSGENVSVAADLTGGLGVDQLRVEVLKTAGLAFVTAFVLIPLYLVLETIQAQRVVRLHRASVAHSFDSSRQKNALLASFILSTILIVVLYIPIISILLFGVLGYFPFPGADLYTGSYTAQPVEFEVSAVQLSENQSVINTTVSNYTEAAEIPILQNLETEVVVGESRDVTTVELVEANFEALDRLLAFLPGPTRLISTVFLAALLYPATLFLLGWLIRVPRSFLRNVSMILKSRNLKTDYSGDFDIQVRKVSDEQGILIRPLSLLFGFRRYVLVSESVADKLEGDELNAVLAHERYHLENRDLQIGKISKALSFCFGGKNALLAFYDYPRIEQEADDYAADKYGEKHMIRALDKIDILRHEVAGYEIEEDQVSKASEVAES